MKPLHFSPIASAVLCIHLEGSFFAKHSRNLRYERNRKSIVGYLGRVTIARQRDGRIAPNKLTVMAQTTSEVPGVIGGGAYLAVDVCSGQSH